MKNEKFFGKIRTASKAEPPQSKIKKGLESKKILVLGFGQEGIDSYLALRKLFPEKILALADKKGIENYELEIRTLLNRDKNLKLRFGENYLKKIGEYDLIIKTPGIPEEIYRPFIKKGSEVSSQTKIFFDNFPGLIIGVTGSKGKGTTASLIYAILKQAGLKVFLGGNIGKPVFQYLLKAKSGDVFVYELSSHQLQDLKKSPQIAVFLNLYPDHLDYYKNFRNYRKSKENIALFQSKNNFFIYNDDDKLVKAVAKKTPAQKIPFNYKKLSLLKKIITEKETALALIGNFNKLNILAAVLTAQMFGLNNQIIKKGIKSFKGLPHRLEFVGEFKGIKFYDNSMATIPEAAIAVLDALPGKIGTVLAGGSDKGSDYKAMAEKIVRKKADNLILFSGATGEKLWQAIKKINPSKNIKKFSAATMKEAVRLSFAHTAKNKICLLSPGSASFNIFKDYKDRGEQFQKWVKKYGQKSN